MMLFDIQSSRQKHRFCGPCGRLARTVVNANAYGGKGEPSARVLVLALSLLGAPLINDRELVRVARTKWAPHLAPRPPALAAERHARP
jgi:hypothetical protein